MRKLRSITLSLAALLVAGTAHATQISFGLDFEFSGPKPGVTEPSGPIPWVTALFDDDFGGAANTVRLTLSAPRLTGGVNGEALAIFQFNLDDTLDPTQLTFTPVDNTDSVPVSISRGVDAFMADGDGNFDIKIDFPQPPGQGELRFTEGETVIYDIGHLSSSINATSFLYRSAIGGGNGIFFAGAQIQRTGGGSDSAWIGAIPEPATGTLLGLGLVALSQLRRSQRGRSQRRS